jgi:hypothetical protein
MLADTSMRKVQKFLNSDEAALGVLGALDVARRVTYDEIAPKREGQ